jgi:probable F420-dependent oxidoreductase
MAIADRVKIGVALPQAFLDGPVDVNLIRQFMARVDTMSYQDVWGLEGLTGRAATLEPLHLLTYVAGITSRIRLGVSVLVMPRHNPVQLAKRISTIDQLSGGRLTMGIGVGGSFTRNPALGVPEDRAARRVTEGLAVMKALWTEPAATYEGQLWQLKETAMEPKPMQRPHPPVWFGGSHPDALRRAARLGDGWMGQGGGATLNEFRGYVALLKNELEAADRDPSAFPLSKRLYIAVDDNEARARERMRTFFGGYYNNADNADRVAVWGSPAHCAEQIEEYVEAGATHMLLNQVFDHMEHLESLAEITGLK